MKRSLAPPRSLTDAEIAWQIDHEPERAYILYQFMKMVCSRDVPEFGQWVPVIESEQPTIAGV